MLYFLLILILVLAALYFGARYHALINTKINQLMGKGDALPAEFQLWLEQHKGEHDSIGKAMCAWADAKFGDRFNNLLK